MLKPVDYLSPTTVDECLRLMKSHRDKSYRLLAGGTDLVVRMKENVEKPRVLIDLSRVKELARIEERASTIHLGAMVTFGRIISSELLNQQASVLVAACQRMGSPQIRSRATLGGNIANASPAGDSIPPLLALDASLELQSPSGSRIVPLETFFRGPGQTILAPDELIIGIQFPKPAPGEKGFFLKLGQRRAVSISKISIAGQLLLEKSHIAWIRIAYGAVASTPLRAHNVEDFLRGKALTGATIQQAAEIAPDIIAPITDIRSTESYRRKMSSVLLRRGLEGVMEAEAQPGVQST